MESRWTVQILDADSRPQTVMLASLVLERQRTSVKAELLARQLPTRPFPIATVVLGHTL